MYESQDKYTVYFSKQPEEPMLAEFRRLINESDYENYQVLIAFQSRHQAKITFEAESSYPECHLLLWALHQAFGAFELEGYLKESEHPPGCWYETEISFQVDSCSNFELEIEFSLARDEENPDELLDSGHDSEECLDKLIVLEETAKYASAEGKMEKFTSEILAEKFPDIGF